MQSAKYQNSLPSNNHNPFLEAIIAGDIPRLQTYLNNGYSVNPSYFLLSSEENPLCVAIMHGQPEMARFLVSQGADVNFSSTFSMVTPLALAAKHSNLELVKFLINANATVNNSGVIHAAVEANNLEIAKFLLVEMHANVNEVFYINSLTPMHVAAAEGNIVFAEFLLSHGADINALGGISEQAMPLAWAAEKGDALMVAFLLEHGAKTDTYVADLETNNSDNSPFFNAYLTSALFNAILSTNVETIKLLVNAGVDKSLGLTSLGLATIQGDSAAIVQLNQEQIDMNGIDTLGLKPIHYATLIGDHHVIETLVTLGADINAFSNIANGEEENIRLSPLHFASLKGDYNTAYELIHHGAQVDLANERGQTALHILGDYKSDNREKMVDLLIDNGANINAFDKIGNTPLHIAAEERSVEVIKCLIKDGADPFLKNNHGHSAFDMVNQNAHGELEKASLTKLLLESVSHQEGTNTLMTADVLHLHDDIVGLTHEPVAHKAIMASYSNEVVTTVNLIDTVSLAIPVQTSVIEHF